MLCALAIEKKQQIVYGIQQTTRDALFSLHPLKPEIRIWTEESLPYGLLFCLSKLGLWQLEMVH